MIPALYVLAVGDWVMRYNGEVRLKHLDRDILNLKSSTDCLFPLVRLR